MPNDDTHAVGADGSTADNPTPDPRIAGLALLLRQAGLAEQGLGFALDTLGLDRLVEELRTPARFASRCARRATLCTDREERAAWAILAALEPAAVANRLDRAGLAAGRRPRARAGLARRSPFDDDLAEVALALVEAQ